MASAFGIFLLRQAFKSTPKELEEAARLEGCGSMGVLWRVYVPLARPTYLAYALVSISHHWNNFLWPLIVTNSVETRPLTVGLGIFGAPESGVNWSNYFRGHPALGGPAAHRFSAVPAAVCSVVHVCGYQIAPMS